jgi:TRAP-type C4-dicarboxylate transport system permease small subunit
LSGLGPVEKAYAIWRAFQDKFLAHAATLLMFGCTLLALLEVVRRYVFGFSYEWQQDAVTYFMLSGVFLYFGIAQRHGAHLNVELFVSVLGSLGPRARRAAEIVNLVALVMSVLFLAAVVWWGVPEVRDSLHYETRTESLGFPMWPFLATLLAGFALMGVTMVFQIYRGVQALRGLDVLVEPPQADGRRL